VLDLSIIIVNYNVKEFIQNLLHSVVKAASGIQYEVIIVDNASNDGSIDFLKEKFPDVKLIANSVNRGFSRANNQGLAVSKGEYLLLLNPDTLLREDTLKRMIDFFKSTPDAGLAGCKILNPDGTLQLACRRSFPGPWTSFCKVTGLGTLFPNSRIFARYNLTYLDENQTYEVDAVSGSFMMLKREVYEKIGGLDEQFFMYGEDLDLCYRVQKAGYKVYYVHNTQIIHYKGESTKRSGLDETKIFYEAMNLFVKKHLSSSILVEAILHSAIAFRKFFAFLGRRKIVLFSIFMDFSLFNISLLTACKIYERMGHWQGFPPSSYPIVFTIPALLHILVSGFSRVYRKDSLSVLRAILSIFISFFLLSALTFFFKQYAYSRAALLFTYLVLFFALPFWRIIFKIVFKFGINEDDFTNRRTIIVGVSANAIDLAKKLKAKPTFLHHITGLIGFTNKDLGTKHDGFEVIGTVDNIKKVINEQKIKEVIFSSEELSYNQMMSIVSLCQDENVEFKLVGNNLDFIVGKTSVSMLEDLPMIEINYNISRPLLKFIKSLFDFAMASVVLFFIYPFIYLTVKMSKKQTDFRKFILNVPNVFKGRQSFVGPEKNEEKTNLYLGKKGLTGFWYIENSEGVDKNKLDIFYAKNQNIWLDMEIIGKSLNKMWISRL
jgi:GT2 family glycosyltransferase